MIADDLELLADRLTDLQPDLRGGQICNELGKTQSILPRRSETGRRRWAGC